jgi:hypothetical protein
MIKEHIESSREHFESAVTHFEEEADENDGEKGKGELEFFVHSIIVIHTTAPLTSR